MNCFPGCLLFSFPGRSIPVASVFISSHVSLLRGRSISLATYWTLLLHLALAWAQPVEHGTHLPHLLQTCSSSLHCFCEGHHCPLDRPVTAVGAPALCPTGSPQRAGPMPALSLHFPLPPRTGLAHSGHCLEGTDHPFPGLAPMAEVPNLFGNKSNWGCHKVLLFGKQMFREDLKRLMSRTTQ